MLWMQVDGTLLQSMPGEKGKTCKRKGANNSYKLVWQKIEEGNDKNDKLVGECNDGADSTFDSPSTPSESWTSLAVGVSFKDALLRPKAGGAHYDRMLKESKRGM